MYYTVDETFSEMKISTIEEGAKATIEDTTIFITGLDNNDREILFSVFFGEIEDEHESIPDISVHVNLEDLLEFLFEKEEDEADKALNETITTLLNNDDTLTEAQKIHRGDQVRAKLGLPLPD